MAYKVGTTSVIDDSGNVDWSRITNKPVIGTGDVTDVTVINGTPTSGATGSNSGALFGTGARAQQIARGMAQQFPSTPISVYDLPQSFRQRELSYSALDDEIARDDYEVDNDDEII